MNDELRKRISDAIDRPGGIEADKALVDLLAGDPEAAAYARDLRRVDRSLRRWPPVQRSDEAWEALAQRIEQRLDEALAPLPDPTRPPVFDDDRRDPSGQMRIEGQARDSNLEKLRSIDLKSLPPGPPPPPARKDGDGMKPAPLFAAPAPLPPRTDERFSIPDVPQRLSRPFPLQPVDLAQMPLAERKKKRTWLFAGAGAGIFAAAAVALLAVTIGQEAATEQMAMSPEAPSATAVQAVPPAPGLAAVAEAEPTADGRAQEQTIGRGGTTMWAQEAAPPAQTAATPRPSVSPMVPGGYPGPSSGGNYDPATGTESARLRRAMPARTAPEPRNGTDRIGGSTDEGPAGGRARPRGGGGASTTTATGGGATGGGGGGGGETAGSGEGSGGGEEGGQGGSGDAPVEALPEVPDRAAVRDALQSVQPAVRECARGAGGVANITITVASTGRVTSALVTGQYAGTPQGSCMARAARAARFPRFSRPTMQVTYPFQL